MTRTRLTVLVAAAVTALTVAVAPAGTAAPDTTVSAAAGVTAPMSSLVVSFGRGSAELTADARATLAKFLATTVRGSVITLTAFAGPREDPRLANARVNAVVEYLGRHGRTALNTACPDCTAAGLLGEPVPARTAILTAPARALDGTPVLVGSLEP
jgi:hypothetical protein